MDSAAQTHFDHIAARYTDAAQTWRSVYDAIRSRVEPLIEGKRVLDIGNGGYFPYEPSRAKSVTVVDISPEMLERIRVPGVSKLVDDARTLAKVPDSSFDVALYFLCLHHINGDTPSHSVRILEQVLTTAKRKLTAGGRILVAEPSPARGLGFWQDKFFPLTRRVLAHRTVSMIYFFRRDTLRGRLASVAGVAADAVLCEAIPVRGWVDPLGGSFPGILRIPSAFLPTRYHFFEVRV